MFCMVVSISTLILLWLIVGTFFSISFKWFYLINLVFGIFSYYRPKIGIYLLLFSVPIFGNRPSMEQTHYLILLSSCNILGIYANLFKNKYLLYYFKAKLRTNSIVSLFIALWFMVSFLSLIGLPMIGMIKKTFEENYFYIFTNILTVGETTLYSSVQSVFYSVNAVLVAIYFYGTTKHHEKVKEVKNIFLVILAGLFFAIFVGQLDYFGLINLGNFRELDRVSVFGDRLASFFAHSGWFAQYLAILLPLFTVFLLFKLRLGVKIILMIVFIIIGEVTLILAMQRGAWLTYPPTLFIFWTSIYYTISKAKNTNINIKNFIKQNWIKIFVTIPVTIIISIFVVVSIKDYRKTNEINGAKAFNKITQRLEGVTHSNDRLLYWPYAYGLWKKAPVYGGGGDSFGWEYKIYYAENDNPYFVKKGTIVEGGYGTAHNMYLQSFVGRGVFGVVFLLGFIFTLLYKLIKKEFQENNSIEESIVLISIIGSLIATVIYGNVQEIFYSQSVQIIFWIIIFSGILLTDSYKNLYQRRKKLNSLFKKIVVILLALIPLHIITIYPIKLVIMEKLF